METSNPPGLQGPYRGGGGPGKGARDSALGRGPKKFPEKDARLLCTERCGMTLGRGTNEVWTEEGVTGVTMPSAGKEATQATAWAVGTERS